MERILLYYPAINIPNGTWLRNALLYTDKVSSIFPFEDLNDVRVNDDTKLLYDEEQYHPIYVFDELRENLDISRNDEEFEKFENNFIERIKSNEFQNIRNSIKHYDRVNDFGYYNYGMYINKLTHNARNYLEENNFFTRIDPYQAVVEKNSAILYMSMLAEYLARKNNNFVIPSTDDKEYEKIGFQIADNKISTHKIILENCLPTPSPEVSLEKILKFKKERKQELLQFRELMDNFEKELINSEDDNERKYNLLKFKENYEKEVSIIYRLYGDSKLDFILSGFSSLLDFKSKDIAGTITGIGITGGSATAIGSFPILGPVGVAAGALILIGTFVSSYNKIKRQVESNSCSYIYFAQQSGIINN